jgi:hypothetical protein
MRLSQRRWTLPGVYREHARDADDAMIDGR